MGIKVGKSATLGQGLAMAGDERPLSRRCSGVSPCLPALADEKGTDHGTTLLLLRSRYERGWSPTASTRLPSRAAFSVTAGTQTVGCNGLAVSEMRKGVGAESADVSVCSAATT